MNRIIGPLDLVFLASVFVDHEGKAHELLVFRSKGWVIVADRHCPVSKVLEPDLGTDVVKLRKVFL